MDPGGKMPMREVDHSPTRSNDVKNEWNVFLLPYMTAWHSFPVCTGIIF